MSWVAVGVAVASAAVSQYSAHRTAKKQDANAARGIAEQARLQREANARTNEQLDVLETSTPDEEFRTRSSQIRDQLRKKQQLALSGIETTGGGDAVKSMAAAAKPQATGYGDDINEWLSGMAAPQLQRQGEAFMRADTGSALNSIMRDSAQQDYLTRLRGSQIRPNPWLGMLATGLSTYAGTRGFGGGNTIAGAGGGGGGGLTTGPLANAPPTMMNPFIQNTRSPYGIGSIFGNGIGG